MVLALLDLPVAPSALCRSLGRLPVAQKLLWGFTQLGWSFHQLSRLVPKRLVQGTLSLPFFTNCKCNAHRVSLRPSGPLAVAKLGSSGPDAHKCPRVRHFGVVGSSVDCCYLSNRYPCKLSLLSMTYFGEFFALKCRAQTYYAPI